MRLSNNTTRLRRDASARLGRRSTCGVAATLLVACAGLCWPSATRASGMERTIQGDDLRLVIDSRWAGCAYGGYLPIRLVLTNTGPSRMIAVTYSLGGGSQGAVEVRRQLLAESNTTQRFTLSVPLVSNQSYGVFRLYADGRRMDRFQLPFNTPDFQSSSDPRPSLIIISRDIVDCAAWEASIPRAATSHSPYGGSSGRAEDHQIVSPEMLPEKWIDYSGVDVVAIPLPVLEKLPAASRTPLLEWVVAGGHLMVYEAGTENGPLETALGWKGRASTTPFTRLDPGETNAEVVPAVPVPAGPVPTLPAGAMAAPAAPVREVPWFRNRMAVRSGAMGLGRVVAFAENPFPGSVGDWQRVSGVWPTERRTFPSRFGVAPRDGEHNQFYEFLIPGVGSAPVTMFLVLMTAFAVAIGPLNLWLLSRKRKLYLMLLTVPVLSLVTCVSLFVYAVVADGFGVKSRVRSVTYLDQGTATAVKLARISLYAGLSPSGGMTFDAGTAVLPVWPNFDVNSALSVDWTATQHLSGGWLPSRTHTQFLTMSHVAERGRVNVGTPVGDKLRVENGLATELRRLVVVDDSGRQWFGKDIPAGAATELAPRGEADLGEIRKLLAENAPAMPPGLNSPNDAMVFGGPTRSRRYYPWGGGSSANFTNSLLEQLLRVPSASLQEEGAFAPMSTTDLRLPKRSYYGLFQGDPGTESGVRGTDQTPGSHAILGRY